MCPWSQKISLWKRKCTIFKSSSPSLKIISPVGDEIIQTWHHTNLHQTGQRSQHLHIQMVRNKQLSYCVTQSFQLLMGVCEQCIKAKHITPIQTLLSLYSEWFKHSPLCDHEEVRIIDFGMSKVSVLGKTSVLDFLREEQRKLSKLQNLMTAKCLDKQVTAKTIHTSVSRIFSNTIKSCTELNWWKWIMWWDEEERKDETKRQLKMWTFYWAEMWKLNDRMGK